MEKVRITKIFTFEMAHALLNYEGPCKNIHGHSYSLHVTIVGSPLKQSGASQDGMVMDFSHLKKIVFEEIVSPLDHALVLNEKSHYKGNITSIGFDKVHFFPFQPTCENMLLDFSKRISGRLPAEIKLYSLKLFETASSYAEWYAGDNE